MRVTSVPPLGLVLHPNLLHPQVRQRGSGAEGGGEHQLTLVVRTRAQIRAQKNADPHRTGNKW